MRARETIKAIVPEPAIAAVRQRQARLTMRAAQRAFASAAPEPAWLDPAELVRLQARFRPPPSYSYDQQAIAKRGAERANRLANLIGPAGATLEVGAGDGMVSHELAHRGFQATALDLSPALFDERAERAGVQFVTGDAAAIPLEDDQFDLVASYNSFEHFAEPEQVLRELIRVTKPGGTIHLDFGPLYYSAYGLHGYRSVHAPYSQLLFQRGVLEQYVDEHGLDPIPFESLNGWTVGRFRRLWAAYAADIETISYREIPQIAGRDVIAEYPSCFRAKTDDFDDLLVALIRATFRVATRRLGSGTGPAGPGRP